MIIIVKEKVRYYETDMMGIAHHSNHIRWFECGRSEYLQRAGVDLNELMKRGIIYPIKHVSCEYLHPIYFGDILRIETTVKRLTRAQMVCTYRLVRDIDDTLLAIGETQNVFALQKTGAPTRLDLENYNKLKVLQNSDT